MKLKTLIDSDAVNDPPATDATVLAWLKELQTVNAGVDYQALLIWGSEEQIFRKVKFALSDEVTNPGTWITSVHNKLLALDAVLDSGGDLDLSRDELRTMINNLSGAGLPLSNANKTALYALADLQVERWQLAVNTPLRLPNEGVIRDLTIVHVATARAA